MIQFKKQRLFLFAFLVVSTIGLVACKAKKEKLEKPKLESVEIKPEVIFDIVTGDPLRFFIESRGVVEPSKRIQLTTRISGFVLEHNIQDGKFLKKGDIIIRLDEEEWRLRMEEARNKYLSAKAQYEIELRQRGTNGGYATGDTQMVKIATGFADAEVQYDRAKLDLSYAVTRAPFDGTISTAEVITEGAFISSGRELGFLLDANTVRIRFDILERELSQLRVGMNVELKTPNGENRTGKIIALSPQVDSKTKTGQAIVEVTNTGNVLRSGMTVEGRVFVREQSAKVKMPRNALLERDGRHLVFKLNNGELEWIYVTPVAMTSEWVLVDHEEIFPGDTLAVDQHFSVSHQQKVIPRMIN